MQQRGRTWTGPRTTRREPRRSTSAAPPTRQSSAPRWWRSRATTSSTGARGRRTWSRTGRTRSRRTVARSCTARQPPATRRGSCGARGSSGRPAATSFARCCAWAPSATRSRSWTTSAAAPPTWGTSRRRRGRWWRCRTASGTSRPRAIAPGRTSPRRSSRRRTCRAGCGASARRSSERRPHDRRSRSCAARRGRRSCRTGARGSRSASRGSRRHPGARLTAPTSEWRRGPYLAAPHRPPVVPGESGRSTWRQAATSGVRTSILQSSTARVRLDGWSDADALAAKSRGCRTSRGGASASTRRLPREACTAAVRG